MFWLSVAASITYLFFFFIKKKSCCPSQNPHPEGLVYPCSSVPYSLSCPAWETLLVAKMTHWHSSQGHWDKYHHHIKVDSPRGGEENKHILLKIWLTEIYTLNIRIWWKRTSWTRAVPGNWISLSIVRQAVSSLACNCTGISRFKSGAFFYCMWWCAQVKWAAVISWNIQNYQFQQDPKF